MSSPLNDVSTVKEQYQDGTNLNARIALHARFSTAARNFHDWLFDFIQVRPDARVLELGCGTGQLWRTVQGRVPQTWRLVLSDLSYGMVSGLDLSGLPDLTGLIQNDAQSISFADMTFDALIANHMLYHVPDLPRALAEVRRVLVPGGKLYAATNGPRHMREFRGYAAALGVETDYLDEVSFRLDNGAQLLAPYFASVERHGFPDELHITEAEPLIGYILSMRGAAGLSNAELMQRLRALIDEHLARDGMIRIHKESGLFVACT